MHDVAYRTLVYWIDPSPLGLVGNRWAIEHRCTLCRETCPPTSCSPTPKPTPPRPPTKVLRRRHVPQANPRQRPLPRNHWR